ncbi:MAG TPA: sigma 54-interacting transcriptional regulator [Polyangiaceae bacterium]|nr:sigma 54-interacting transcriptional regulator [Polyangiaceae bacterium]
MTDTTTLRELLGEKPSSGDDSHQLEMHVVHSPDASALGRRFSLVPGESALVGRRQGLELSLEDERTSRSHVRIVWDQRTRGYRFADLGSANGTFLNGQRLETGVLSSNDVLRVGDTLLVCSLPLALTRFDEEVRRAAASCLPVLLLGETGTGKEVLAKRLHEQSGRSGAFIAVNCAALPRELATAELFGHTRGAFSGAGNARDGLIRAAAGGTLFLDEIAELPIDVQPTLLRCLQERKIRTIGADREVDVDLRLVAATNADLESLVGQGKFREDLLARLAHILLKLAPLRTRRWEILPLARQFAPELAFTANAIESLLLFDWPRNIRQLRSLIESLAVLKPSGARIHDADLAERIPGFANRDQARQAVSITSDNSTGERRTQLTALLQKHSGNIASVARELGKPRSHVYRWMRTFRLSRRQFDR